ncbi:LLM class flavin-dependent oxidoreductase [Rhizobium rhizogenes]|uniref:LLM class flavin-dependent oxidoreductase n=1 Tax=Rhizobium rhizogenes TaxID=359 RepID=UPI0015741910|nr:LLM class flavin-dependent oxidoreductase [Rhizobium rhizogenes]NTI78665.1 LLM class flavin-dependent oxidoreductase [Rhizobium rhizogenes]
MVSHSAAGRQERQLHLNINIVASGRHASAWRLQDPADTVVNIEHFRQIARIAERGTLDALFFADHPSLDDSAAQRPWTALDPTILLTAMAAVTDKIGLVATASTTFDHPYHIARRYASLDHVSGGRAAWNVVTTQHNNSAPNFGLENLPSHADRHKRADEFVSVVTKLWDSWDDDAIVADPVSGRYVDMEKVRPIEHVGDLFSVRGALNVPRSPQGRPVIITAGISEQTQRFASRWADALFTVQRTIEEAREFYAGVKSLTAAAGRDPAHLVVLPGLYPVIGSTEAEAKARKREMDDLVDMEDERIKLAQRFGVDPDRLPFDKPFPDDILDHLSPHISRGFVENLVREARRENLTVGEVLGRNPNGGHRIVVGSPEQIADDMEHWFQTGAADGYNLNMDAYTSGLELFVEHVVPELRRRGIFRREYSGSTLRDHFGLPQLVLNEEARARRAGASIAAGRKVAS